MPSVKEHRERVANLLDRVQAIASLPEAETTAEHKAEVTKIMGHGKIGDADYAAGELANAEVALATAQKIEAKALEYAADRANGKPTAAFTPTMADQNESAYGKIVVPAQCRYTSKLKAFSGPDAERKAYAAGRYIMGYVLDHGPSRRWCQEHGIKAAQSESSNAEGAVLVPELLSDAIIMLRERYGVFRQYAKVMPMGSDVVNIPRRSTGLTAYFVTDNGTLTESEKTWDQVKLVAKKAAVLTRWSNELNDDAIISIADDVADEAAYAFAKLEDTAGFTGNGEQSNGGIVGAINVLQAGSIVTAASTHTGTGTLTFADFEGCVAALPNYVDEPTWFMSQTTYWNACARLMDAAGGNKIVDIAQGQMGEVHVGLRFLGLPVAITQAMDRTVGANASKIMVLLGDLSLAATLGDRKVADSGIMISKERYFDQDQTALKMIQRFDINCHEQGTSTTAGALVGLKTASS